MIISSCNVELACLSWLLGAVLQGLAGGLALLCLFMTYIQYATAGREGFLAFYSPQAEVSSSSSSNSTCSVVAVGPWPCCKQPQVEEVHA
jgi:hypothetical protein